MKKVLIISFLMFIILLGCFNTVFATSPNNETPDQVIELRIGDTYTFYNVAGAYFPGNCIDYDIGSINIEENTYAYTIKGINVGETTGLILVNDEFKTIHVKVAKRFVKNVLIIPPTKTKYDVGENLDLDGLKITVIYDKNEIEDVEKGYTVKGYNKYKEGKQAVTISYQGFSRTYNVKVGNTTYDVNEEGKLPQTGNFSYLKNALYVFITVLSIAFIFIVFKIFKYNKVAK